MNDFFYNGTWRMDWGLGNPNKTAALIASLMVAIWAFAYVRKWGFWISAVLFCGLGVCLIHTASRGGLLAAAAGVASVLAFTKRPWKVSRILIIVASVWVILASAFVLKTHSRYTLGVKRVDQSIGNRLKLWGCAPLMMVDSPSGWGIGKSGAAYGQWYQSKLDSESYRTLVNSHLTWLVELGWSGRYVYVFALMLVIVSCMPPRQGSWLAVPFGIWISFAVAAWFSSVAEAPILWVIPVTSLISVLVYRVSASSWPKRRWLVAAICSPLLLSGTAFATRKQSIALRGSESQVILGNGPPVSWLVVDESVLGRCYGKTLRTYCEDQRSNGSIGIVRDWDALPRDLAGVTLYVAGHVDARKIRNFLEQCDRSIRFVFLSPRFDVRELSHVRQEFRIKAYFGEFAQSSLVDSWREEAVVESIAGVADFFPNWPELIADES